MRFCSLGSGSEGNGFIVEGGDPQAPVRLLVDCGFGRQELERRLLARGLALADLGGVLVTHEHGDHVAGVARLARATSLPVYATHGTWRVGALADVDPACRRTIDPHRPFEIGAMRVEPMPVPHDAREPAQFVFDDGRLRLGILTDLGHATAHLTQMLRRLDALVIECNHDVGLLENSHYPPSLKRRIGGAYGHLANDSAAALLARIDHSRLRCVVAAHLSRQNNRADLAQSALAGAWGCETTRIRVADQDDGLDWITV